MLTITLESNRSTPRRFVAITRYERRGNKLVRVRRVYDGPNHCVSTKDLPWNEGNKEWCDAPNGEKGDGAKGHHSRPFTIKRDWLRLHMELQYDREEQQLSYAEVV